MPFLWDIIPQYKQGTWGRCDLILWCEYNPWDKCGLVLGCEQSAWDKGDLTHSQASRVGVASSHSA